MGKSRSAAIIMAFLMCADPTRSTSSVLSQVRETRPSVEPNEGFMKQLEMYHDMKCPTDLDSQPRYQRWLYQRAVRRSNAAGVAPDPKDIFNPMHHESSRTVELNDRSGSRAHGESIGEPESKEPSVGTNDHGVAAFPPRSATDLENTPKPKRAFRCRRCRQRLATSDHIVEHKANPVNCPPESDKTQCAHVFVDPLSWMTPELEKGTLSGRFECPNPKCRQNLGKYAWQGMKCSCGEWVVPGLSLMRGKVDEVKMNNTASSPD